MEKQSVIALGYMVPSEGSIKVGVGHKKRWYTFETKEAQYYLHVFTCIEEVNFSMDFKMTFFLSE